MDSARWLHASVVHAAVATTAANVKLQTFADAYSTNDQWQTRVRIKRYTAAARCPHWEGVRGTSQSVAAEATSLVSRHILCVRCGAADTPDTTPIGPRTFVCERKGVLFHVWGDRREARRFQLVFQRLAQAKFEHLVPAPFHVPLAALVRYQGAMVSVVWLPPIVSAEAVPVSLHTPAGTVLDIWRSALGLRSVAQMKLFRGHDGRYYVAHTPDVIAHTVNAPRGSGFVLREGTVLRSETIRRALQGKVPLHPGLPVAEVQRGVEEVAGKLIAVFRVTDESRMQALRAKNRASTLFARGVVADAFHSSGLNLQMLPAVADALVRKQVPRDDSTWVAQASEAVRAEIAARTLKALLGEALAGVHSGAQCSVEDVVQQRLDTTNAIVKGFIGSAAFFDDTFLPAVHDRFGRVALDRAALAPSLAAIMKTIASCIGLQLSESRKRVESFITQAVSTSTHTLPADLTDVSAATGTQDLVGVQLEVVAGFGLRNILRATLSGVPGLLQRGYSGFLQDVRHWQHSTRDQSARWVGIVARHMVAPVTPAARMLRQLERIAVHHEAIDLPPGGAPDADQESVDSETQVKAAPFAGPSVSLAGPFDPPSELFLGNVLWTMVDVTSPTSVVVGVERTGARGRLLHLAMERVRRAFAPHTNEPTELYLSGLRLVGRGVENMKTEGGLGVSAEGLLEGVLKLLNSFHVRCVGPPPVAMAWAPRMLMHLCEAISIQHARELGEYRRMKAPLECNERGDAWLGVSQYALALLRECQGYKSRTRAALQILGLVCLRRARDCERVLRSDGELDPTDTLQVLLGATAALAGRASPPDVVSWKPVGVLLRLAVHVCAGGEPAAGLTEVIRQQLLLAVPPADVHAILATVAHTNATVAGALQRWKSLVSASRQRVSAAPEAAPPSAADSVGCEEALAAARAELVRLRGVRRFLRQRSTVV